MLYNEIISKTAIEKGWSGDKKYLAVTKDGTNYLLRTADIEKAEKWYKMFDMQKRVASLGLKMCEAVEIGECEDGIYTLQTWIDGEDARDAIPQMCRKTQYALGYDAGTMLKKIHSIPAPDDQPLWEPRFNAKIDRKIRAYENSNVHFDGARYMLEYIEQNRSLLVNRPQCYQHGDYHIGNMMFSKGDIYIIDFDRYDFGDPWEEFNRIVWCAQASPAFAAGTVDGYFDCKPPIEFWKLIALYICSNTLSSIPWAIPFGEKEITVMLDQAKEVLEWYDNMTDPIPAWYKNFR